MPGSLERGSLPRDCDRECRIRVCDYRFSERSGRKIHGERRQRDYASNDIDGFHLWLSLCNWNNVLPLRTKPNVSGNYSSESPRPPFNKPCSLIGHFREAASGILYPETAEKSQMMKQVLDELITDARLVDLRGSDSGANKRFSFVPIRIDL